MATVVEVPVYGKTATFIVSEANGYRSREQITVLKGGKYPDGLVLQLEGGGEEPPEGPSAPAGETKFVPFTGGEAAGILFETIDASDADVVTTAIVRDCEVQRAMLKFVGDPSDAVKDQAYASLAAAHIVMR